LRPHATITALLAAVHFITVHAPNGQEITINVAEISSIRQPREAEGHFENGVQCLLIMTNGKLNGVVEPCLDVIRGIAAVNK
jgi:hypothetical protein